MARISGNNKLFRLDLDNPAKKTQLTFGTHDDAAPQFLDADTLVVLVDGDRSGQADHARRSAQRQHLQPLDAQPEDRRAAAVHRHADRQPLGRRRSRRSSGTGTKIAFVTYYKGEYGLHTLVPKEPKATVATRDFGEPGPVIDFQAPLTHTLVKANQKKKGTFEKLFLDGRPPVNVGVTSGGDLFGGTQVSFADVLGDQQFNLFVASVSQYRTLSASYLNLVAALPVRDAGLLADDVLLRALRSAVLRHRRLAVHRSRSRGRDADDQRRHAFGIYPLNRYSRVDVSGGVRLLQRGVQRPGARGVLAAVPDRQLRRGDPAQGQSVPLGVAFVQEDTVFREFGPLAGTHHAAVVRGVAEDGQHCSRARRSTSTPASTSASAARACSRCAPRASTAGATNPDFFYFGGNSELRGYDYLSFVGQKGGFLNAELRFPLIEAMLTPIGVLGGIRGVFFAGVGGATSTSRPTTSSSTSDTEIFPPLIRPRRSCPTAAYVPIYQNVDGQRLPPARRPRVLRRRPRELPPRVPDPLRLLVEDALQQGVGRRALRRVSGGSQRVPQDEVPGLDRLRFLTLETGRQQSLVSDE